MKFQYYAAKGKARTDGWKHSVHMLEYTTRKRTDARKWISPVPVMPSEMLSRSIQYFLMIILIVTQIWGNPLRRDESHPLSLSELNSRIEARVSQPDEDRLPLPTPQQLGALKKVAQILAMLGEQVIPAIVGEPPAVGCATPAEDAPNDFVAEK